MIRMARPYSQFVEAYDALVGWQFFQRVRRAFTSLARTYAIGFESAADLGCGTGLFACYLNRCWGARVYAVDRSPEMLRVARLRCDGPGVRFLQQDIRGLCLPEPVDLVTANFDTLNHLLSPPDLYRTFGRVAANLRSGGHFYFDIVTPCRPLGGERTYRRALRVPWRCLEQHVRWEPARRLLRVLVVHRWAGGGGPMIERHAERAYEPARVGDGLLAAGLVIRGVHDEATLAPAGRCPARLIVVAQKPGGARS
ncbi:MAG: class I SAM-dependent methyltransferase [Verrucomicrobia bacterium]|nr:class I SAM-dependent methyltransferase [Verrucomicrobiota bacterium]